MHKRSILSALFALAVVVAVPLLMAQSSDVEQITEKPGYVPIGGMVPVMKSITNAWQPPATGALSDGFQLADGAAFNAGCTLTGSTPNMADRFLRGDTSTSGATGGADQSNVQVANHTSLALYNHTALALSNESSHTHSMQSHTHDSDGDLFASFASSGGYIYWASPGSTSTSLNKRCLTSSCGSGTYGSLGSSGIDVVGDTSGPSTANTGSGSNHTHSFSQNITAHSFSQNITAHSETQSDNKPPYVETVWVIRCK